MNMLSENPNDCRARFAGEYCARTPYFPCTPEYWAYIERPRLSGAWCDGQPFGADQPVLDYCVDMRHWIRVIGVVEWGKISYIPVGKKRPIHTEKYTIHLNGEVGAEYIAQAKRLGERALLPAVVDYADADQGVCDE